MTPTTTPTTTLTPTTTTTPRTTTRSWTNSRSSGPKKPDDGRGDGPPKPGTGPDIQTKWPPLQKNGTLKRRSGPRNVPKNTNCEEARARRRAAKARARHPDKVAAAKQRYREKHEAHKRYYHTHVEQRRAYDRQRAQSEHRRAWIAQNRAKHREALLATKREPYLARYREKWRTAEKMKALGPLKLTVTLEDFCQSLETDSSPSEASFTSGVRSLEPCCLVPREDAMTVMDMDSGDLHPLDYSVWNCSDDSVCDGSLDDLSSFCDMPPPDWNQWFDELMEDLSDLSSSSDDSLDELLRDMSPDEWSQLGEDPSFHLDDFVS